MSALFSPADVAAMRRMNEENLPHLLDFFVPTLTEGDGGVTAWTYPTTPTVANLPCRIWAQGGLSLDRVVAGAQGAPGASYLVILAAGTPVPNTAKARIRGETPVTGADPVSWTLWLDVQGPPLLTTYEMERKALGVVTAEIADAVIVPADGDAPPQAALGMAIGFGNSWLSGYGIDNVGTEYLDGNVMQLTAAHYGCPTTNHGVAGKSLADILLDAAAQLTADYDPDLAPTVAIVWEGRNEYAISVHNGTPQTAQQTLDQLWALVDLLYATEPDLAAVIVAPSLPTVDPGGANWDDAAYEVWRLAYNAGMVTQAAAHGATVADLDDALVAAGANTNLALYNADQIHPNAAGYALAAPAFWLAIDTALEGWTPPVPPVPPTVYFDDPLDDATAYVVDGTATAGSAGGDTYLEFGANEGAYRVVAQADLRATFVLDSVVNGLCYVRKATATAGDLDGLFGFILNGHFRIGECVGGVVTYLTGDIDLDMAAKHTYDVQADGPAVTGYVDGTQVHTATTTVLAAGYSGVTALNAARWFRHAAEAPS